MKYSTGSKALDELFGGYYTRVVHEFYGPTKAGKTTLSSYVPIGRIYNSIVQSKGSLPPKARFFVIDGDGGFDFERAEQVWKGLGIENTEDVFDHLVYWQPTSFEEQHNIIAKELNKQIKEKSYQPLFIAADPLVAIYRGIILRTSHKYRMVTIGDYTGKLDLELITLRHIAVKYNIPVVVTSWPGSKAGEGMGAPPAEIPVIGGRAFGFMPKLMVELRIPKDGCLVREAFLYKHRSKPEGRSCYFKLTDAGIADVTEEDLKEIGVS